MRRMPPELSFPGVPAAPRDIIHIEQVDRLLRLDEEGWQKLKRLIQEKYLLVVSIDLPTSLWLLRPAPVMN